MAFRSEVLLDFIKVLVWPVLAVVLLLAFSAPIVGMLTSANEIELDFLGVKFRGSRDSIDQQLATRSQELQQQVNMLSQKLVEIQSINDQRVAELQAIIATADVNPDVLSSPTRTDLDDESALLFSSLKQQLAQTQRLVNTGNFDVARENEMKGFDELVSRSFGAALRSFEQASAAYPEYHNVYEITQLLDDKHEELLSVDTSQQTVAEVYARILEDFSWGMPDTPKRRMIDWLEQYYLSETAALRDVLSGDRRRDVSDRLAAHYEKEPSKVISALVDAILPDDDSRSYRVNIYIARTLAAIQPDWQSSNEQCQSVFQLTETSSYQDKTFRENVDRAISRYAGPACS